MIKHLRDNFVRTIAANRRNEAVNKLAGLSTVVRGIPFFDQIDPPVVSRREALPRPPVDLAQSSASMRLKALG